MSFSWWMLRACFRVVFGVVLIGGLSLLHLNPALLQGVVDGTASPLSLVAWGITTPGFLAVVAIAAVVSFALPFLPDRDPHGN